MIFRLIGLQHQQRYLNKHAVPTIFAWNTKPLSKQAKERQECAHKRSLKTKLFQDMPSTSSQNIGDLLTYYSEAYAGSVSDRQIVERSKLFDLCEKGDSIMADRGFNVQDLFASKGIGINIPSFLKGKSQIPSVLLKNDQKIARHRVHIERNIGLTKTYKILTSDT
ncbi:hypothetical protein ACJJTC_002349 [Scirpophaga incertulas]